MKLLEEEEILELLDVFKKSGNKLNVFVYRIRSHHEFQSASGIYNISLTNTLNFDSICSYHSELSPQVCDVEWFESKSKANDSDLWLSCKNRDIIFSLMEYFGGAMKKNGDLFSWQNKGYHPVRDILLYLNELHCDVYMNVFITSYTGP